MKPFGFGQTAETRRTLERPHERKPFRRPRSKQGAKSGQRRGREGGPYEGEAAGNPDQARCPDGSITSASPPPSDGATSRTKRLQRRRRAYVACMPGSGDAGSPHAPEDTHDVMCPIFVLLGWLGSLRLRDRGSAFYFTLRAPSFVKGIFVCFIFKLPPCLHNEILSSLTLVIRTWLVTEVTAPTPLPLTMYEPTRYVLARPVSDKLSRNDHGGVRNKGAATQ